MLYALAQKPFVPKKYFSIDRVFRNEAVDRTHLAEFHQMEGLICDRGLTLGDLIGVLKDFFARLGMPKLLFKPAYNPYTEPSMEIFSYHEKLGKWVEIGNSGMFRPEMLRPMGLPEDVQVIAWGLGLERPTMILYGIDNIRDLFGHKKPFVPKKYFSIDRVFRNEAVDRTHLAEFHQMEGLICDRGLTLGDLIGVLKDFFARLGMPKLLFKPAYNPYTEPSMEIFSYHEKLGKWVEIGNSGMFRPEMLRPMGLPEDVQVIAWGLGLERPTMILYGIDNIRDLFGHKVDLGLIKRNPICRIGI
ncbi:PREDICTED: phenylalanine--tRNA ligase alpha subunit, cytoplasmic-like [Camelina sativa]|uniref:phenylalanine--tRNA ligase n=1 Tax=Camelina sativa TaxID=90675 RepID=A0ABM1RH05_CAMSA|nr:PREDICTED: phenylalanine--tRNA ligase alpha subunit, cytoplasmic-like [Camelina sativa]